MLQLLLPGAQVEEYDYNISMEKILCKKKRQLLSVAEQRAAHDQAIDLLSCVAYIAYRSIQCTH